MTRSAEFFLKHLETAGESIAGRLTDAIRREIAPYTSISRDALLHVVRDDLAHVAAYLAGDTPAMTGDERRRSLEVARKRTQSGIPVRAFLEAVNVGRRESYRILTELGLPPEDEREIERALADWAGSIMAQASHDFLQLSRGEHSVDKHRESLLRALFNNEFDAEVQSRASMFGLQSDTPYRAFAAVRPSAADVWSLAPEVVETGGRGYRSALVAELEGRLVGVVAQMPTLGEPDAILGLGPCVPIAELGRSYAEACRVLDAAAFIGRVGVLTLGDVAFESAMLEDVQRSQALADRYVTPLLTGEEASARILETVTLWLELGGNVQEVADSLTLHPNTIRYRLRAYRDRTGQDLTKFESRCRAWWALCWHRARV